MSIFFCLIGGCGGGEAYHWKPSPLLQSSYLLYLLICMERKLSLIVFIYKIKIEGSETLVHFIAVEFVFIK